MKKFFSAVFIIVLISGNTYAQKLGKSKGELNKESAAKPAKSNSNSDQDCDDGLWFEIIVDGLVYVGYVLVGDYDEEPNLDNNLTPYPFYNGQSGNFEPLDSLSKKGGFRIDFEDHFLYSNNNLMGNHMKAKIRPFQYFYFQGDYRRLSERQTDNRNDYLSLFHFNFCYDRLRFEKFNLGWNLGASYIGNEVKKAGFCYGLSADYFMTNRLSFSAAAKWSRINQQPVNTYEFQGKLHRRNFFFALGYQYFKIASPTYSFIALGGGIYF